jgi:cysteine desulfurase
MNTIYLDYNATTPIETFVAEAMRPYLELCFGNPSSLHRFGSEAKIAVEGARTQVAKMLNAHPDEIIFTSGGSESNNLALKGAAFALQEKGNHIITSSVEHPAVTEVCRYLEKHGFTITWLPVDAYGRIDPMDLERAITKQTVLISVMHANNETGTIQPVEKVGAIARKHGILFHSDAAQSIGKIPVDVKTMQVDLLSVAGHKFYAPKGVGALYIRRGVKLEKLIHGADHESNLRAGTENVMQIVGLGSAAERVTLRAQEDQPGNENPPASKMRMLRDLFHRELMREIPEIKLNGHPEERLPNTLSLGFPGVEAALLLDKMRGVAASAGAACHADDAEVSGVLSAMGVSREFAMGTVRFSLGRMTSEEEIMQAVPQIVAAYRELTGNADHGETLISDKGIKLTEFTHSLGCACKIRPQLLEKILHGLPSGTDPNVLVGFETSDDAAVYKIDDDHAIVQTVDFIPPVVDDPYEFGAIAAANALSDVYAMGGKPIFALSIVGFPDLKLPLEVLENILKGANDKVKEAGISIIGGHSIEDIEPKFGLVVTGMIHPRKILYNSGAQPGDLLVLTKPIGTGIVTTAMKRGLADEQTKKMVVGVMAELNRNAGALLLNYRVNACTDVTGFGLLGHLLEMVKGSGVSAALFAEKVPIIPAAWGFAAAGAIPGGTRNNLLYVAANIDWDPGISEMMKFLLADAQTSGGLLISLPETDAIKMVKLMHESGIEEAAIIGKISKGEPIIRVQPREN